MFIQGSLQAAVISYDETHRIDSDVDRTAAVVARIGTVASSIRAQEIPQSLSIQAQRIDLAIWKVENTTTWFL
jgi:hypothetical protein